MKRISAIVPCYNEEESLPLFYDRFLAVAEAMQKKYSVDFELIFVDDGSKDRTLSILESFHAKNANIRYLSFSRNFGKEAAMYAGMEASKGDYVVILDADLQHPPEHIEQMYRLITEEGYDCVAYRRSDRKNEPKIRSFFARMFYKIINKISSTTIVDGATDFRLMTRQMVDSILSLKEYNRFSKGIFSWVGYRTKWLDYQNVQRAAGSSKWSFRKLFLYSIEGITDFSVAPLALASCAGILFCGISFIWLLFIFIKTLIFGDPVAGFPTLACMILLLGGIQLLCIGILGEYIAKIYLEIKNRPIYIVQKDEHSSS